MNTIFKLKLKLFIKMYHTLNLSMFDLFLFLNKAETNYQFNRNGENPLVNNYNFQKL